MKFTKHLIASAVLLATSSAALAASSTDTINIKVTQDEFVNLVGTAFSTTGHTFTVAQLDAAFTGTALALGTLGTESNLIGNCDVAFTSANAYELKNGATSLTAYTLTYNGNAVTSTAVTQACNFAPANLTMKPDAALPAANTIAAGDYTDVVTVVVTSI